jgi:hypothetical protein
MSASGDDLDQVGGACDGTGLKQRYRRREAATAPRNGLAGIEREILAEIASQSGRYGERLDALWGEMQALRCTIEQTMAPVSRSTELATPSIEVLKAHIAVYNRLRRQAQQVQHYLIIHREAMGFWYHDDVFRCYPMPTLLTPLVTAQTPAPPEHS